jgi:hypothetical protein
LTIRRLTLPDAACDAVGTPAMRIAANAATANRVMENRVMEIRNILTSDLIQDG